MIMKWLDVEPGDTLRWTDEAYDRFGREDWWSLGPSEEIIVKKVEYNSYGREDIINFWFTDKQKNYRVIYVDLEGKYLGVTLFELVSLGK